MTGATEYVCEREFGIGVSVNGNEVKTRQSFIVKAQNCQVSKPHAKFFFAKNRPAIKRQFSAAKSLESANGFLVF
jgi:hypothetical protein